MFHGPVQHVHLRNLAVQIAERQQAQVDGIAGPLDGPPLQLVQIPENRVFAVERAAAGFLPQGLLDGVQIGVDPLLLVADRLVELLEMFGGGDGKLVVKQVQGVVVVIDRLADVVVFI